MVCPAWRDNTKAGNGLPIVSEKGREMRALDVVQLSEELPESGLHAGVTGTILEAFADGAAVLVEFMEGDATLAVIEVKRDQLRLHIPYFAPGEHAALLLDLPEHKLKRGQVAEIVSTSADGTCRVKFDETGQTIHTLPAIDLMPLYWQPAETSQST